MAESNGDKKRPNANRGEGGRPAKKFFTSPQAQDMHTGVLASADRGREQRAAKELIDLFDEVADLYFPLAPEEAASEDTEGTAPLTLEQELAQEMAELKKSKNKRSKRFIVIDSGCKNMVLIKFMDKLDPNAFVIKVFEHLVNEVKRPRTRYSNRLLPIEKTCHVSDEAIMSTIKPYVERVFREENPTNRPFTYRVEMKVRNNDRLNKDNMKMALVGMVGKGHFVDLKRPQKLLLVEVFTKAAGVAVVDNTIMEKYSGFNIRTVSESFGEPLPPHPDELLQKKSRKDAPKPEESKKEEESAEPEAATMQDQEGADGDKAAEVEKEHEETEPAADGHESDSDSDNGGISLF